MHFVSILNFISIHYAELHFPYSFWAIPKPKKNNVITAVAEIEEY